MPSTLELVVAEVDRQLKRRLGAIQIPILTQQGGTPVSGGHRVLNFTGAGVTVSDDPAARRTNINIPGSPTATSTTTIQSTAGTEKVFTLTNGDIAGAPANWQTTGFSDSGWSNSVLMTVNTSAFFIVVPGTDWVSDQAGSVVTPAGCLIRRTFTLPAGTIASAQLLINVDDTFGPDNGLYLNGTSIAALVSRSGTPTNYATVTISPSLLVAGGSNALAAHDFNPPGATGPHSLSYKLTVTYSSGSPDPQYIPKAIILAKGDVIVGASASTPADLGVGTDGQVLTARSSATNGVDWETPASGGMADPTTTKGDLIVHGTSTTRLGVGTDGSVLTADSTQTLGVKWAGGGTTTAYVRVEDHKSSGTDGGTFTSGADRTRDLNTIVTDTGGIASLSANQITLPAGTYDCTIFCPAFTVDQNVAWLRNITDSTDLVRGQGSIALASSGAFGVAIVAGRFTLSGTKALEVRHRCLTTKSGNGFGPNIGASLAPNEVYTVAEFWKVS